METPRNWPPLPAVGTRVYLRKDLGDRDIPNNRSVVVPRGTPGAVIDYENKNGGGEFVRIAVPTSPGQHVLSTFITEFHSLWTENPPLVSRWEWLIREDT